MTGDIRTFDLSRFNGGHPGEQARELGLGLEETGFVKVVGHGLTNAVMAEARLRTDELFDRYDDRRFAAYERPDILRERGACRFGEERAVGANRANALRFWHIGRELSKSTGDLRVEYERHGHLRENVWPDFGPPAWNLAFRASMLGLFRHFDAFVLDVVRAISGHLGAHPQPMVDLFSGGDSVIRLLDYPPPDTWPPGQHLVRNWQHVDSGAFTFLASCWQNFPDEGLEIRTRDGQWLQMNAGPGELVLNSGKILGYMTNGRLDGTWHRVARPRNPAHARRIITCFVHPKPWRELFILPGCGEQPEDRLTAWEFTKRILDKNYAP